MKKIALITMTLLTFTACAAVTSQNAANTPEGQRLACLNEAEHIGNKVLSAVEKSRRYYYKHQDSAQTKRLKTICRELALPEQKAAAAQKCDAETKAASVNSAPTKQAHIQTMQQLCKEMAK